jgi:hypothetical protein
VVTSIKSNLPIKRFNSYEILYDGTRKRLPFNTGDCLIVIKLMLNRGDHMGRFDLIEVTTWEGLTTFPCGHLY